MNTHPILSKVLAVGLAMVALPPITLAFCGFYVSKADTKLFNEASKVVLARKDDKTVITMVNDYHGPLKDFAIVVPVPSAVTKEQVHVTDNAIVDHLDAYTAPRLVEYFDEDPCNIMMYKSMAAPAGAAMEDSASSAERRQRANALGVTIEDEYTVGEYDILILSAKQSDGLQTWLSENGYKIPPGATSVLDSYIKQNTKFFVAKVNLHEQAKVGGKFLRPLQVAFESPKFMLPIRLGTVNAKGAQELFIFMLTPNGRVETTNYRTVKMPSDTDVPLYVKDEFSDFYRAMFSRQVEKENMQAVFMEYAWDMAWCDPCAADPLSAKELRELGVFWQDNGNEPIPMGRVSSRPVIMPQAQNVFVTRLHVRYDRDHFPDDLRFQETGDRTNFQGRYVMRHPWTGKNTCDAAKRYKATLPERYEKEAQNLSNLTGWNINDIRKKMASAGQSFTPDKPSSDGNKPWYVQMWGN